MKSIIKKLMSVAVVAILALTSTSITSAAAVSWAFPNNPAYGTINGLTGNSMVASKPYGSANYTPTSTASAGDKVAVVVYFHNDGNMDSQNTIIKLDRPSSNAGTSFTLNGSVSGGTASRSSSTTITLSSSQTLTFIPGSLGVSYDRGATRVPFANEADIFNGGLNIGLIRGMNTCGTNPLCAQGAVALGFQVSSTQTQTGSKPSVITGTYLPFSEADGFATLNGSVSPNGAASCTYFEWRNLNNSGFQSTGEDCSNSTTTGNFSFSKVISSLTSGTHEYRACARNSFGTQCGSTLTFRIDRPVTYQCNDGIDNDGDGFTDLADPACTSATDNTETPFNTVPQCIINSFTASPLNVNSGGYTTLNWNTTNCDQVTIDGINYPVDGSGNFGPLYAGKTYEIKAWKSATPSNPQIDTVYVGVNNVVAPQCNDGIDNDGDGYVDMNDPACTSSTGNTESPYNTAAQCIINNFTASPTNVSAGGYTTLNWNTTGCDIVTVDGVNYPVDGSGNFGPLYTGRTYELKAWRNTGSAIPQTTTVYVGVNTVNQTYQCNDGIDNDGDGRIDYPNDQGCTGYTDDSESPYDYQQSNLSVYTENYSWINQDSGSVTLRGRYTGNTYGSTRTYFEYRLGGQSARTVTSDTSNNSSLSFNVSLYNLTPGTYYYRACASNSYTICGEEISFYVGQNYGTNQTATIQTLSVLYRGQDAATLDGYLNIGTCSSAQTYFQYGRNGAYGSTTAQVYKNGSGSISQGITGLSPNTTYYYQAIAQACGNTIYGSQLSFTTLPYSTVYNPPVINNGGTTTIIRNITTGTNIGGGARYIRLTIDNGRDTVVRGDELIYDVTWENITKTDLDDLVLEISFPEGLQIIGADRGQIDRKANTIYVNIRELRALEKDDMTVRAHVKGNSFKDNDPITARAIIAFENPENKAQENAIAYDSDSYLSTQNVLGASIFGLDFLPGTLAGWLFIILLLILVILIIRYTMRGREQHHHYYPTDKGPMAPVAPEMTPVAPMVTKTTEVEYTPYRPTPKL
jgi:hypothetical protein